MVNRPEWKPCCSLTKIELIENLIDLRTTDSNSFAMCI